jgi:hypothetical protein
VTDSILVPTEDFLDPVIEAYKKDVDLTLIRENLALSHEERLVRLQKMLDFIEEVRRAGEAMRSEQG